MKLEDFRTNPDVTITDLRCRLRRRQVILKNSGRIRRTSENFFSLITEDGVYDFQVSDPQDLRLLAGQMLQNPCNLACVTGKVAPNDEFFLRVVFFYDAIREPRLNILLAPEVKKLLEKKKLLARGADPEESIRENFMLTNGTDPCYAFTRETCAGKTEDTSAYRDDEEDGASGGEEKKSGTAAEARPVLRIYGRDYSLRVVLKGEGEEEYLYAESADTQNRAVPPMALRIGRLTFQDGETFLSEKIKKELATTHGYLEIWDKYTSLEGEFVLARARAVGTLHFDPNRANRGGGGVIVYPIGQKEAAGKLIREGDVLQFGAVPPYMEDPDMSWEGYLGYREAREAAKKDGRAREILRESIDRREILKIDRSGFWVLESRDDTLPVGDAYYCPEGDMRQILRRMEARQRIENGTAAMPSLGLVIEGKKPEAASEGRRMEKAEPVTPFVREKIFRQEPRQRQRDAIEIALNTPDIAIIQGPPGTGKTTVITAILERLNEMADKRKDNRGQVLVTSFQHAAVRNVIERLSINSLPTIKFGKKGEDDLTQEKAIAHWCAEYADRLRERNPSLRRSLRQVEFEQKHNRYLLAPNDTNALDFLEFARECNTDPAIDAEIEAVIGEIRLDEGTQASKLAGKIRRLRTTREGFTDDGPERAEELLMELMDILKAGRPQNDRIFDLLEKAAAADPACVEEDLLKSLGEVRAELLDRCMPVPAWRPPRPREEILDIYSEIRGTLGRAENEEDEILLRLLNELEYNVTEVEEALKDYNFVYASTAQQSEGREIRRGKGLRGSEEHPQYETVVIDEAARVNPGDLMIPMAQASRRIILVGDHRQLPHIYDEEIFESMRDGGNEVGKDVIRKSMFEYLKEKADELTKADGISRTITLDAQFRMHPELGDFVNRNFYEPHGEGFLSPRPAEDFGQSLTAHCCQWVYLDGRAGGEERIGTSRARRCEAEYIAERLAEFLNREEGANLTYGVITFYSAQEQLIRRLLQEKGIAENVRVGSVDAFQGMEFDVIFLSVVRSHVGTPFFRREQLCPEDPPLPGTPEYEKWESYREEVGVRYYGFLTSENRLCVALSRQKRLLIAVGNADIFHAGLWKDVAGSCVPALKNFYEMCEDKGEVLWPNR